MRTSSTKKSLTLKQITRSSRWYRNYLALLGSFLVAFCAASTLAPVHNSGAYEFSVENSQTGFFVNVTNTGNISMSIDATPDGQTVSAKDAVTTETNSPRGYKLYLSATPNYLYLDGDSANASSGKFSPLGATMSIPTALAKNTWGFALDNTNAGVPANNFAAAENYAPAASPTVPTSSANWATVPAADSAVLLQAVDTSNYTAGTTLDIYYGANASTDLPAGTYQTTVTYTAVSEGVNTNADTMQDFTAAEYNAISETTASVDNRIELLDNRGTEKKWYKIAKLKDGNCWMVQNLALDGGITLTPDDSDVTENRPLRANITDEAAADDKTQIYSGVAERTTETTSGHALASDAPYGNLYNWLAATAGTGTVSATGTAYESICPKGWRLPDNTGSKSYSNLLSIMGYPSENKTNAQDSKTYEYIEAMQRAPLYIPLAGNYNGSAVNQGVNSYLWSRTVYSNTNSSYDFQFVASNGNFSPHHLGFKNISFPVRCVFEGSTVENNMYLQDINLTMCNNLAESTASSDNRRTVIDGRDNKTYKISKLADGNCWMVQNLALDGSRTLQPTDSNVVENHTLPANIPSGTASAYDTAQIFSGVANNTTTTTSGHALASDAPYGNLYNWNAATATVGKQAITGTVKESICPLNWRLPDNGTASGAKTYSNLLAAYGYSATNVSATAGANNYDANTYTYIEAMQKAPFYIPLAGFYNSSASYQNSRLYLWSRVVNSDNVNVAYDFDFIANGSNFTPQGSNYKNFGFPLRCVLGE